MEIGVECLHSQQYAVHTQGLQHMGREKGSKPMPFWVIGSPWGVPIGELLASRSHVEKGPLWHTCTVHVSMGSTWPARQVGHT